MKDIDDFSPWEMIVHILKANEFDVNVVAEGIAEVAKNGHSCIVFTTCVAAKRDKLDDMFLRVEAENSTRNWIPLSLFDPSGFDEGIRQLEEALGAKS